MYSCQIGFIIITVSDLGYITSVHIIDEVIVNTKKLKIFGKLQNSKSALNKQKCFKLNKHGCITSQSALFKEIKPTFNGLCSIFSVHSVPDPCTTNSAIIQPS